MVTAEASLGHDMAHVEAVHQVLVLSRLASLQRKHDWGREARGGRSLPRHRRIPYEDVSQSGECCQGSAAARR
ncbi:hypothetical protein VFPFJ_08937 [Purpureocillium lilacinum]|uniref:Uncharacterized protein n=1 Tax=Purpureocillium lilacinum TaxID=33203 RepID=A0A179GZ24_PURLI|nr:hypothetical protein VFPFJ_08937 [Purpureocillium lilacinum]OAQ75985.1 hypothetical protein VFPBJ_08345 [Purpureocillium lilacinum]OAQ83134.1 hypothetical protein VFPFJ_08937 [Purpureocillium lilacinum]